MRRRISGIRRMKIQYFATAFLWFCASLCSSTESTPGSAAERRVATVEELEDAIEQQASNVRVAPGVYNLHGLALQVMAPIDLHGEVGDAGNTPIFECGSSDEGALELRAGGFVITSITFRSCGGAAPVLVDLRNSTSGVTGEIAGCSFEGNAGFLAGGVAVVNDSTSDVNLTIRGCSFTGNMGSHRPGDYIYDYDYAVGMVQRPISGASALALGRGNYTIVGCSFSSNVPDINPDGLRGLNVSTGLDLSCWQGPANFVIEDTVFQDGSGRQSGGIYLQGHPDGVTASTDCNLVLRRVLMRNLRGYQSGALLASCTVKGSQCSVTIEDSEVRDSYCIMSGIIMARDYGMSVDATNLTMTGNYGGAYGSVQVATTFRACRLLNNKGRTFATLDSWGGSFVAHDSEFSYNVPDIPWWFKTSAARISNSYGSLLKNCTFDGNLLHALFVQSAALTIDGCRFRQNRAVTGALFPYGAGIMLYGTLYTTYILNSVFEDNVALAGGAIMLSSTQSVVIDNCTFRGNRAISGGAVEVDIPIVSMKINNTRFLNNTAVAVSDALYGEGGIIRSPPASKPKPDDRGDYADYGIGATTDLRVPVESCGNGGGGALCVRGATDVPVTLQNLLFAGNLALMGGGLYAATGSRCQELVGCYRLALGPNVTFKDNHAELAGGAVFWLYERIVRSYCSATDMSLVQPAWSGLLEELSTHTFTAISLAVIAASANVSSPDVGSAAPALLQPTPPLLQPTPPLLQPTPPQPPVAVSDIEADNTTYLDRVAPCASWSGNSVGAGGYGPHIATSAFFHLPMLVGQPEGVASLTRGSTTGVEMTGVASPPVTAPLPPSGQAAGPQRRLLMQTAGDAPAEPYPPRAATPPAVLLRELSDRSSSAEPPPPVEPPAVPSSPPAPPRLPAARSSLAAPSPVDQLFSSGDAIPIEVHIFDYYGQRVTRSMVDSPSSVLVTCSSLNALGQKAAEAVNGVANFTQLRVRDKVGRTYVLNFTARTAIREMGPVSIDVNIRACRINEELVSTGDACTPCIEGFYAIVDSSQNVGNSSSSSQGAPPVGEEVSNSGVDGSRATCSACPDGAVCSSRSLGGVIAPLDGYWHSAPWSDNVMTCQFEGACTYGGRTATLAEFQEELLHGGPAANLGSANASAEYRQMQCAPGYTGNLCASCAEGYGRTSPAHCSRCRGIWVRLGYGLLVFGITFVSIVATIRAALAPQLFQAGGFSDHERSVSRERTMSAGRLPSGHCGPTAGMDPVAAGGGEPTAPKPALTDAQRSISVDVDPCRISPCKRICEAPESSDYGDDDPNGSRTWSEQVDGGASGSRGGALTGPVGRHGLGAQAGSNAGGTGEMAGTQSGDFVGGASRDVGGGPQEGELKQTASEDVHRRRRAAPASVSPRGIATQVSYPPSSSRQRQPELQLQLLQRDREQAGQQQDSARQEEQQGQAEQAQGRREHQQEQQQQAALGLSQQHQQEQEPKQQQQDQEPKREQQEDQDAQERQSHTARRWADLKSHLRSAGGAGGAVAPDVGISSANAGNGSGAGPPDAAAGVITSPSSGGGRPPMLGALPAHGKMSFASLLMALRQRRLASQTPLVYGGGNVSIDGGPSGAAGSGGGDGEPSPMLYDAPSEGRIRRASVSRNLTPGSLDFPYREASTASAGSVRGATHGPALPGNMRERNGPGAGGQGQGTGEPWWSFTDAPFSPKPSGMETPSAGKRTSWGWARGGFPRGPPSEGALPPTPSGWGHLPSHTSRFGGGSGAIDAMAAAGALGGYEDSGTNPESESGSELRPLDSRAREADQRYGTERTRSAQQAFRRSKRTGYFAGRSWRKRIDVISEHATVIKILVSYLQVVSLVKNTPVTWPRVLVNYFNVAAQASSAASSLASLDCSMRSDLLPKSVQTFIIAVLSPLYWSVALCLFWLLRTVFLRYRGRLSGPDAIRSYMRTRCIITINCIIFIQYPSVVSQLFSLFSCMRIDTAPHQLVCVEPWDPSTCSEDRLSVGLYWTQDLEQRCYEGIHLPLCLAVGVPGVLLFAAGMPLLSAWWLYRNRARLRESDFSALYGTLYQEYEDEYYFWESIVMLRKFAITAVIVFAGTYRWQLTLLLALGVIALALMAQVAYRPYESDTMDELERLGLVTTLVTFYLATYFMGDTVGSSVRVGLSFAILVLNAITIFILIMAILRELHRAAIYKLLRVSSARGDLPLSFVVRIGALYMGFRLRVFWTQLRISLGRVLPPCCRLGFPSGSEGAAASVAANAAASAAAAAAEAAVLGAGRRGGASGRRLRQTAARAAALAAQRERRATLRAAWEEHHHSVWMEQVMLLSERLLQQGATPRGGGGGGGAERSLWKRIPTHLAHGVKRAARSVTAARVSVSRLLSGRSFLSWQSSVPTRLSGRVDDAEAAAIPAAVSTRASGASVADMGRRTWTRWRTHGGRASGSSGPAGDGADRGVELGGSARHGEFGTRTSSALRPCFVTASSPTTVDLMDLARERSMRLDSAEASRAGRTAAGPVRSAATGNVQQPAAQVPPPLAPHGGNRGASPMVGAGAGPAGARAPVPVPAPAGTAAVYLPPSPFAHLSVMIPSGGDGRRTGLTVVPSGGSGSSKALGHSSRQRADRDAVPRSTDAAESGELRPAGPRTSEALPKGTATGSAGAGAAGAPAPGGRAAAAQNRSGAATAAADTATTQLPAGSGLGRGNSNSHGAGGGGGEGRSSSTARSDRHAGGGRREGAGGLGFLRRWRGGKDVVERAGAGGWEGVPSGGEGSGRSREPQPWVSIHLE